MFQGDQGDAGAPGMSGQIGNQVCDLNTVG